MEIKSNAWFNKIYLYWVREGISKPLGYRENLCHYIRVLVFWAPLAWLGNLYHERAPRRLIQGLFIVLVTIYVVGVVAIGVGALVYFVITQPLMTALVVGTIIGSLVVGTLILVGFITIIEGRTFEVPGTVKLIGSYIVAKKRRICPSIEFEEG